MSNIAVQVERVTFYSPGSFMPETSTEEISRWDPQMAAAKALTYRRKPYAFQFTTHGRAHHELNARELDRSGMYYLGGTVITLRELESRADPGDQTLISNMRCNGWPSVIRTPYGNYQPFMDRDTLLENY